MLAGSDVVDRSVWLFSCGASQLFVDVSVVFALPSKQPWV